MTKHETIAWDCLVGIGLAVFGYGVFDLFGAATAMIVLGSAMIAIGLVGARGVAIRKARERQAREFAQYRAGKGAMNV